MIFEGSSDSDILNEYIHLRDIGELNFPLRTDAGFIKDRRREMEIASEVLKDSIKKIVKPFILKQREEHYAQLADISAILLRNNLNTVIERQSEVLEENEMCTGRSIDRSWAYTVDRSTGNLTDIYYVSSKICQ